MLHVYRMLNMLDPIFARQAENLAVRSEDLAKIKQYKLPEEGHPPDAARASHLATQLSSVANSRVGLFPFAGLQLSRGDITWLLSNSAANLDLRAANLEGADLRRLDLTGVQLGLTTEEYEECLARSYLDIARGVPFRDNFQESARVRLQKADLSEAELTSVSLVKADLRGAVLMGADLSGADLSQADLEGAQLHYAKLTGASLRGANLRAANLSHTDARYCLLSDADATDANLLHADLRGALLTGASLCGATLKNARFDAATDLSRVHLIQSQHSRTADNPAFLVDVNWGDANLTGIDWELLTWISEERPLRQATLTRAKIQNAKKRLDEVVFNLETLQPIEIFNHIKRVFLKSNSLTPRPNLTAAEWGQLQVLWEWVAKWSPLVEESVKLEKYLQDQMVMFPSELFHAQVDSARAYRQLGNILRDQGRISDSARFAYRALKLERLIPRRYQQLATFTAGHQESSRLARANRWLSMKTASAWRRAVAEGRIFSSFLVDLVCGYGYRPLRAFAAYFVVVLAFAGAYALAGMRPFLNAIVFSITSFHGRGFAELLGPLEKASPYRAIDIAAVEAFVGLLMEVVLVATFTRRLFDR